MPNINGRYYMNPNYGAAMERSRQAEGGGTFDVIVKSIESGSTRPLLEEILRGSKDSLVQPDGQNDSSHTPKIVPVAAQATASQNQQYAPSSASARDSTQRQAHDDSDGHWVTIDHRHILIQGSQGNHPQHAHQAAAKANQQKRKDIADIAKEYNHSTAWAFDKKKDDFPAGSNKCNKFVYDVTKEAGAKATVKGSDGKLRPPLASEWADPHTAIPNWLVLGPNETPQPGDVAAYPLQHLLGHTPYTGHSGIVSSVDSDGTVHAIAAHADVVGPDDTFQPRSKDHHVAFRRYAGG